MAGDTVRMASGGYQVNGRWLPDASMPEQLFRSRKDAIEPLLNTLKQLQIPYRGVAEDVQSLTIRLTPGEKQRIHENLSQLIQMEAVAEDAASYTFVIPFDGYVYRPDSISLKLYLAAIRLETGGKASVRDGKLWLDGHEATSFRFRQDYCWMLSDGAEEAIDSRHLGLIPSCAVVGNVWFCWFSKDKKRIFRQIK
jgi:signal peptidase I